MNVSVSGTIDQKTYLKKFRGNSAPLPPPGSAYETCVWFSKLIKKSAVACIKNFLMKRVVSLSKA